MKKFLALLLAMTMVLGSAGTVFADEADADTDTNPEAAGEPADGEAPAGEDAGGEEAVVTSAAALSDIGGTAYEEAVTALFNKKIVTGDPEGTFRPEASITRAEACVVVVRALGASAEEQAAAASSGFTDLENYDWAWGVINYAAERGIVSGRGDSTFAPADQVTYAEMAVMLIKAQGISTDDITGEWPANYINKALELGMLGNVVGEIDGGAPSTRGNVAIMTYTVLNALEAAQLPVVGAADVNAPAADGGEETAAGDGTDGEGTADAEGAGEPAGDTEGDAAGEEA